MTLSSIQIFDVLGASCSLIATWMFVRANPMAWPISLGAILINLALYWKTTLYADFLKESFYLGSTLYGWALWTGHNQQHREQQISRLDAKQASRLAILALIGTGALTLILRYCMHSTVALWDASTTVISFIAQWLLCRKIIETWALWFVVDALYVGLYTYKGLYVHAGLMLVYTGLAIVAYAQWRHNMRSAS